MSATGQQPTAPQPNTVADAPATVQACAADYANAHHGATTPGQTTATPHTHGRQ